MPDKRRRPTALLVAALTMSSLGLDALQGQVDPEASVFMGGTWFVADPPERFALHAKTNRSPLVVTDGTFAPGFTLGVNAGVRIGLVGLEGMFAAVPTRLRAQAGVDAEGEEVPAVSFMYGGSVLYHFRRFAQVEPFLGVGVGGETMSYDSNRWASHSSPMVSGLAGVNVWLDEVVAIRLDLRHCISSWESGIAGVDDRLEHDLMLGAGLSFRGDAFRP